MFKHLQVISGPNNSRFPYCTSLLIADRDIHAIVDPGAGPDALHSAVGERPVNLVINTHYHFDHISGNHLFPHAQIWMNPIEADFFPNLDRVAERLGIKEIYGERGVEEWKENVADPQTPQTQYSPSCRHEWWLSSRSPIHAYAYDIEWQIGQTRVVMVHAPGHTEGFCCPYFPDEGLVYTGDIDLTSFGPWYADIDGNIGDFIASARRIAQLDSDWFLTGHQAGMVSRSEFQIQLDRFLNIIGERHHRLIHLLESGVKPEEIHQHGLLYMPKYQTDPWIAMWERIAIRKHLEWMNAN
ncbi:MBL fold metallo-hydrolase [Microaerobacter geothermalis]|uniref:MBL fold metallo-hydrolase n=1 Tax=Microaerobacter geothermalis TaxID=674972 RepID=UPI001F1D8D2B|nr:MBL fold metallo-hydrolase [Microaerobacter geothermalis]MCF6093794.1 MBL fold metallo-hydrolase [Microaerobacter geothermalis]